MKRAKPVPGARQPLTAFVLVAALLCAGPPAAAALARIADAGLAEVQQAIDVLAADFGRRGVRIQRTESAVQMVTAPQMTPYVERFLGVEEDHRLSHAALETLAIIAYKQPITRQAIEKIRGVDCAHVLASLRARSLITEVGRAHTVGRPYLFGTTFRFLEYFGLEKPEDLPPLANLPEEE